MKQFPSVPRVANAPPDLFDSGHLWIQEKVDGANFRFRLRESGMLEFGDRSRVYRDADEIPAPFTHAVRHVRGAFDREALRAARDDVASVVFFGEATYHHAIDYDWDRMPSFLGFDVWEGDGGSAADGAADDRGADGRFLPPDAVEQVYDQLGLDSVNAFQKEVRATDFDPESYEIPDSNWYDGPAEGVVLRNKTGQRAKLLHPDFRKVEKTVPVDAPAEDVETAAEELAREYATRRRIEKIVHELEDRELSVTFDAVYPRVVEDVIREEHKQLFHGDAGDAEWAVAAAAFRSEIAAQTRRVLDGEE
jgi:ATP-dependent RNA circularization protein (DNA/RNA ligase family)